MEGSCRHHHVSLASREKGVIIGSNLADRFFVLLLSLRAMTVSLWIVIGRQISKRIAGSCRK
jgi:hypothetical protein